MNRTALLVAVISAAALLGCRTHHLGEGTGKSYRAAFQAQIDGDAELDGLSAEESKAVMQRHRTLGSKEGAAAGRSGGSSSAVSDSSPDIWRGSTGPIELQAK